MPLERALQFGILPLKLSVEHGNEFIEVVASSELSESSRSEIRFMTGRVPRVLAARCTDLKQAIFIAYHGDPERLRRAVDRLAPAMPPARPRVDILRTGGNESDEFLPTLIEYAHAHRISDLHFIPMASGFVIQVRKDGELQIHDKSVGDSRFHQQCVSRIKILCGLDTTQHHKPQDGSFHLEISGAILSLRVGIIPTVHGEKMVLRLLGIVSARELGALGLDEDECREITNGLSSLEGAVVIAGPTGSGKSTTLYALMKVLGARGLNLMSAEDPVEVYLPGVAQTQVDLARGMDYPTALKAFLRQDPDVIMIGEIRDAESARLALQASTTGHLVLTSVHASDIQGTFTRFRGLGVTNDELSEVLKLMICQRLIPSICSACKVPDLRGADEVRMPVFRGAGCEQCHRSGYLGRTVVMELLKVCPKNAAEGFTGLPKGEFSRQHEHVPLTNALMRRLKTGQIDLASCRSWI